MRLTDEEIEYFLREPITKIEVDYNLGIYAISNPYITLRSNIGKHAIKTIIFSRNCSQITYISTLKQFFFNSDLEIVEIKRGIYAYLDNMYLKYFEEAL